MLNLSYELEEHMTTRANQGRDFGQKAGHVNSDIFKRHLRSTQTVVLMNVNNVM